MTLTLTYDLDMRTVRDFSPVVTSKQKLDISNSFPVIVPTDTHTHTPNIICVCMVTV